jgi:retron-type reverse transcriptase
METKLARIAEIARERPKEKFTSLAHLLSEEMLKACHKVLKSGKAPGIDHQTKKEYEANLEANIEALVVKLKRKSYRPQPVRRTYIPKPGKDEKRSLGIPSHEDKSG